MSRIEALQQQHTELGLSISLASIAAEAVRTKPATRPQPTIIVEDVRVPTDCQLSSDLHKALSDYTERLNVELCAVDNLLAIAEAAINPPPEPETIFNTPNKWFSWDYADSEQFYQRFEGCDDLCVAVCTSDEWSRYVAAGKEGMLSYYGNNNGTQCASQILDAINDINAGLRVSGGPCNAVIVIKRSK